jgi:hypothetical protein
MLASYPRPVRGAAFNLIGWASALALSTSVAAQAQVFDWVRQFGTTRDEQVKAVALSLSGVYAGGNTIGIFPDYAGTLNDVDAFVARYDNAGSQLWVRQFGSTAVASDAVMGMAADATGVYAVGITNGSLPGQAAQAGSGDIFVRKYGVDGTALWTRQFGTGFLDEGRAAAVDATGVYVGGILGSDGVLRKYDQNAMELWSRTVDSGSVDQVRGVAVHESGIYVVGLTNGALPGPAVGNADVFIRRYDAGGAIVWTRQFGTSAADQANAVAVDATVVYIAGDTAGTFAGQTKAGGLWDEFAAKYDLDGVQEWVRQFGTDREDAASGVAIDATGAYFVGFSDAAALPGQTALGGNDSWVRRHDADGNVIATRQFGTANNDEAYAAAANSTGIYIGGYAANTFPGQTNIGGVDGYLLRIPLPPSFLVEGVVNNGSYAKYPAPVAPGSIAAVFGSNLNDGTVVLSSALDGEGKVVTTLGGSSATVNGVAAPMFYSTLGQLGIQIPFETAGLPARTSWLRSTIRPAFPGRLTWRRPCPASSRRTKKVTASPQFCMRTA